MLGPATSALNGGDEPLSTRGWSVQSLTELSESMKPIPRISASALLAEGKKEELEATVRDYEDRGEPVIVEGWHELPGWPGEKLFGVDWLAEHGEDIIEVRDCVSAKDKTIPFREFIDRSRTIPPYAEKGETERLYGKDAQCPEEWQKWLLESDLPEHLKPGGSEDLLKYLKGREHVETLMCYHGIGDTFTPAHKDLCASNGHNLLICSENNGSAFWFMTASSDAPNAVSYFQKNLGTELDHEARIVHPEEFAAASFTVYVAEQKLGDLVLVPRRSCHQVVNSGGITTKLSWSKMMLGGLETAFYHELPLYRRVCRNETYRIKLLIYRALLEYCGRLKTMLGSITETFSTAPPTPVSRSGLPDDKYRDITFPLGATPEFKQLAFDAERLITLYDKVLREEHQGSEECNLSNSPPPSTTCDCDALKEDEVEYDSFTCDFCGADIFQSFFECRKCRSFEGDEEVLLCPGCVVEGRSCPCGKMKAAQKYSMDSLIDAHNTAAEIINKALERKFGVKIVFMSHTILRRTQDQHPCLFTTACSINRIRILAKARNRTEQQCRALLRHKESCVAPLGGALSCKKCHASRCFKHHLEKSLHVTEACLLHARADEHVKLHEFHASNFKDPIEKWTQLRESEEKGTACDMYAKLTFLARNYNNCSPVRGDLERGWYDRQKRRKVILTLSSSPEVVRKPLLTSIAEKKQVSAHRNDCYPGTPSSLTDDDSGSDYLEEKKRHVGRRRKKPEERSKSRAKELPADVLEKLLRLEERIRHEIIQGRYVDSEELTAEQKAEYKPVPEWALEQDERSRPSRRGRTAICPSLDRLSLTEADGDSASVSISCQHPPLQVIDVDNDQKSDDDPIDMLSHGYNLDGSQVMRTVEPEVQAIVQPASNPKVLDPSNPVGSDPKPARPIAARISDELTSELTFLRSMRDDLTKLPELRLQYEVFQERMNDQIEAQLDAIESRWKYECEDTRERAKEQEESLRNVLEKVESLTIVCQGLSKAKTKLETELKEAKAELTESKADRERANVQMKEMRAEMSELKDAVERLNKYSSSDEDEVPPSTGVMLPPRSHHESLQYSHAVHSANPNARFDGKQQQTLRSPVSAGPSFPGYVCSASASGELSKRSTVPPTSPGSMYMETSPTISAHERKRKRNEELANRVPTPGYRQHWHQQYHQRASVSASSVEGKIIHSNGKSASASASASGSSSNQRGLDIKIPSRTQSQENFGIAISRNRPKKKRARKH